MGAKKIINLATPTLGTDVATKAYVDQQNADFDILKSIVDKLFMATTFNDVNFWNSLIREQYGLSITSTFVVFTYQPLTS